MGKNWEDMSKDEKKYWMIEYCLRSHIHSGELGIREVIETKVNKIIEYVGTLKADLDLITHGRDMISKIIEAEDLKELERLKEEL